MTSGTEGGTKFDLAGLKTQGIRRLQVMYTKREHKQRKCVNWKEYHKMTQSYTPITQVLVYSHTQHKGWSRFDGEVSTLDIHLNEWILLRTSSDDKAYLYQPSFESPDNNLAMVLHEMYKVVLSYANQALRAPVTTLYLYSRIKPWFVVTFIKISNCFAFLSFIFFSFTLLTQTQDRETQN